MNNADSYHQSDIVSNIKTAYANSVQWCSQVTGAQHGHTVFLKTVGYCVKQLGGLGACSPRQILNFWTLRLF